MAGNSRTRNRRHKPQKKAEEKLDRKPVNRQEWLTEKGLELYLPCVSPDGFPGENIVEKSLCIVYINPILHHS